MPTFASTAIAISSSSRATDASRTWSNTSSYGFGLRVIVDGTWGFASSNVVTKDEIVSVAAQAVAIARANRKVNAEPVVLAPVEAFPKAAWNTPVRKNPFDIPIRPKVDLLLQINDVALAVPGASFVNASMQFVHEQKYFASTEGSHIEQSLIRSYPNFSVTSVDRTSGEFYARRALTTPMGMGYEYVEDYPLLEEARVAAEEAVAMHKAKPVTAGQKTLILHPSNLWLTIHESVGHPTELDRALGYEANYAGTSFLTTDKLGKFEFGAKTVNIVADKTQESGLATCGYDDDGVKTSRWHLIKRRHLRRLPDDPRPGASDRPEGVARLQLRRQLVLDSVSAHAQRLARARRQGRHRAGHHRRHRRRHLHQGGASYSIDHQRYNFQFSGQMFWEVKKGKITTQLRDVAYQSNTPEFWKSCDMLGRQEHLRSSAALSTTARASLARSTPSATDAPSRDSRGSTC